jgi:hypothetical protein
MIIFGLSLQHRDPKIPKEVADWLRERAAKYSKEVDFAVNYSGLESHTPEQVEQYRELVKKYSRFFNMRGPAVMSVTFPYLNESWNVKIIFGADKDGNVIPQGDPNMMEKWDHKKTNELRNEIAGLPSEDQIEKVQNENLGEKRREGEPAIDVPREYVEFQPEFKMTSEVSMSGEQYAELANDPATKDELSRAIYEKDWETVKRLKNRKIH